MFQVTFSTQSLSVMNSLIQSEQLNLMEELSSVSESIFDSKDANVGKFNWKGKLFYRMKLNELRVYFERQGPTLHCHFILPKHSLKDFLIRCNLPSSDIAVLENHSSFWEYLEGLTKNKR